MNFAFCIYKYFPYGGLQRDFIKIASLVAAKGHQVTLYTRSWEGKIDLPNDMRLVLLKTSGFSNQAKNRNFYVNFTKEIQQNSVDRIVGFDKMPNLDYYYQGDTCYYSDNLNRSFLYKLTPRYRLFKNFEKEVFKHGGKTKILLLSDALKPIFQRYYHTEESRFYLLPPGISEDRRYINYSPLTRKKVRSLLGIKDSQHLLLQIGSDYKRKGVDRSIRALASLPETIKNNTFLCIIGQDSPSSFITLSRNLGISNQVLFLGARDDVGDFIAASDIFLHPARSENTGTVIVEALAGALPEIVTDVCGYASYVIKANSGRVLSSPYQQSEFNECLLKLLIEPSELFRIKQNCMLYSDNHDLYSLHIKAAEILTK